MQQLIFLKMYFNYHEENTHLLFCGILRIETKPNADGQKHGGRLKTTSTKVLRFKEK